VLLAIACGLFPLSRASAAEYTAFSLNVAQQRISRAGGGWRTVEPEVLSLGSINKVDGFVYDEEAGDLILVGEHEEGRAPLTLDDLVVALRARLSYGEYPLVNIEPTWDTPSTQMQHVRFEGGIERTGFGQALFDADCWLKQLSMGLDPTGVAGLRSYWDRETEGIASGAGPGELEVSLRFWLCLYCPHVVVREGVCAVRGLDVEVFTEVLSAGIGGKAVEDPKGLKLERADAFADDIRRGLGELCRAQPSFSRLRGLQELVAVSKALEELEPRPDLGWWLERYSPWEVRTPKEAELLKRRYVGERGWFDVSGGVFLTAMAMRLNAGDVRALREAALASRPSAESLRWSFAAAEWAVPLAEGQVKPEDTARLFAQGLSLRRQERYEQAIVPYDTILEVAPDSAEAWYGKGAALWRLGRPQEALQCLDRALAIDPDLAKAWDGKGAVLWRLGRPQEALQCLDRALEVNPRSAVTWSNKGVALQALGRRQEALECHVRALEANPRYALAWANRGLVLGELGRTEDALRCYDRALEIDPRCAYAWIGRGLVHAEQGRDQAALQCFDRALEASSRCAEAWHNKGAVLQKLGRIEDALQCYDRSLEIHPLLLPSWHNKGLALRFLGRYAEARRAFEQAAELGDPDAPEALAALTRQGH
jgi:tetratricopeptide (TPR) repeat protein